MLPLDPIGALTLSATQPPLVEPLQVADLRSYLKVDDDTDDDLISVFISGAREQAELFQSRVLVRKSFDLHLNAAPMYGSPWHYSGYGNSIPLAAPTASVDLVQTTDSSGNTKALVLGTDYFVDLNQQPAVLSLSSSVYASSTLIRFTAGYAPDDAFWSHQGARLKAGMLLLIAAWYNNRLPFTLGITTEYPFAVTHCLTAGALRRPR